MHSCVWWVGGCEGDREDLIVTADFITLSCPLIGLEPCQLGGHWWTHAAEVLVGIHEKYLLADQLENKWRILHVGVFRDAT